MNVVFMGSTKFGYNCLERILQTKGLKIKGIVSLDKEFNISYAKNTKVKNYLYYDFKKFSKEKNIQYYNYSNNNELFEVLKNWNPDLIIVIGWYHMIPKRVRELPNKGIIGLHASYLPNYRGNAPLVWALINGETETGVSLFYIDKGVDSGDILNQKKVKIDFFDNIKTLYKKIEKISIEILEETLPLIIIDDLKPKKQKVEDIYIWPPRKPIDGKINFNKSNYEIYNFIRAQTKPYPGAFCYFRNQKLIIWEAYISDTDKINNYIPGEILSIPKSNESGFLVVTNKGAIEVTKVFYDSKEFSAYDFIYTYKVKKQEKLK
jgi:methionyl-tRNA formyltransferase